MLEMANVLYLCYLSHTQANTRMKHTLTKMSVYIKKVWEYHD